MRTIEPCLCGDPHCVRCFPVSSDAYEHAMQKTLGDILALRVEQFLSFLEPDSLLDQRTDAQLRQERECQEQLLRDALARYRGE